MMRYLILFALLFAVNVQAQMSLPKNGPKQVLGDYDFSLGGYTLVALSSSFDSLPLKDSLGEFYTDDIAVLKAMQQAWTFDKMLSEDMCGDDYEITLFKDTTKLVEIGINLHCDRIHSDLGTYRFDAQLLRMFYGKFKPVRTEVKEFTSVAEARAYRLNVLNDPKLLSEYRPKWVDYEGAFDFTVNAKKYHLKGDIYEVQNWVQAKLDKAYPNEHFRLSVFGGQAPMMEFVLQCDRPLADRFTLFGHDPKAATHVWEPYKLRLFTYWRSE
jgi:hypothetical protein